MLFSREEYLTRIEACQAQMRAAGFSTLLVSDPANLFYLTGYNAWSFYTPQLLVLRSTGLPVLYSRQMDAHGAKHTSFLPAEQVVGFPEELVHNRAVHPLQWIAEDMRERGLLDTASTDTVAYEGDSQFFHVRGFLAMTQVFPNVRFVDSAELVNWVRCVKSEAELGYMRKAGQIAGAVMADAVDRVRTGAGQHEVAAAILAKQAEGIDGVVGDYSAFQPMLPMGEATDTPHLTWTDRKIQDGEAMIIELAGVHHRYHSPLARTVALSPVSSDLDRLGGAVTDCLEATLDEVRPGAVVQDLMHSWNTRLAAHGYQKASRLGYSIGVGFPPDWGERTVSFRESDTTVLRENMTFHLIAGVWLDGAGFEVSESIIVGENGAECLADFSRGLLRK